MKRQEIPSLSIIYFYHSDVTSMVAIDDARAGDCRRRLLPEPEPIMTFKSQK